MNSTISSFLKGLQNLLTITNKLIPIYEKAKPLLEKINLPTIQTPVKKEVQETKEVQEKRTSSLTFFQ